MREMAAADVPAVEGSRRDLGDEHEALAARLLESGLKLDSATLAAAAAGLKDTSILEKQLKRAREVPHVLSMLCVCEAIVSVDLAFTSSSAERGVRRCVSACLFRCLETTKNLESELC